MQFPMMVSTTVWERGPYENLTCSPDTAKKKKEPLSTGIILLLLYCPSDLLRFLFFVLSFQDMRSASHLERKLLMRRGTEWNVCKAIHADGRLSSLPSFHFSAVLFSCFELLCQGEVKSPAATEMF